jgi:hypothetical protein
MGNPDARLEGGYTETGRAIERWELAEIHR